MNKEFDPKDYVLVRERIMTFKVDYPQRAIRTEIVHDDGKTVVMKAMVWPDASCPERFFTGHAEEDRHRGDVNVAGSALENCETSAVGRALAFMGYPPERSRAEVCDAALSEPSRRQILALCAGLRIGEAERDLLLARECGGKALGQLTEHEAQELIEFLKHQRRRERAGEQRAA